MLHSSPNIPVELTAHSARFLAAPCVFACGPQLTGGVRLAALERIQSFQQQVEQLHQVETNPTNYRLSASGYLTEIDRMHWAVREYLWLLPVR